MYNIYRYLTHDEIYYVPTRVFVIAVDVYLGEHARILMFLKSCDSKDFKKNLGVYYYIGVLENIRKRTFFSFHFSRVSASRERISENDGRSIHKVQPTDVGVRTRGQETSTKTIRALAPNY